MTHVMDDEEFGDYQNILKELEALKSFKSYVLENAKKIVNGGYESFGVPKVQCVSNNFSCHNCILAWVLPCRDGCCLASGKYRYFPK